MDTVLLIQTFGLQREIEQFVARRVHEIVAQHHDFEFQGGNRTNFCRITDPHPPHVVALYDTVRYGELQKFCLGRAGLIPGQGTLHVVVLHQRAGAPGYPGVAEGYWFVEPAT